MHCGHHAAASSSTGNREQPICTLTDETSVDHSVTLWKAPTVAVLGLATNHALNEHIVTLSGQVHNASHVSFDVLVSPSGQALGTLGTTARAARCGTTQRQSEGNLRVAYATQTSPKALAGCEGAVFKQRIVGSWSDVILLGTGSEVDSVLVVKWTQGYSIY